MSRAAFAVLVMMVGCHAPVGPEAPPSFGGRIELIDEGVAIGIASSAARPITIEVAFESRFLQPNPRWGHVESHAWKETIVGTLRIERLDNERVVVLTRDTVTRVFESREESSDARPIAVGLDDRGVLLHVNGESPIGWGAVRMGDTMFNRNLEFGMLPVWPSAG